MDYYYLKFRVLDTTALRSLAKDVPDDFAIISTVVPAKSVFCKATAKGIAALKEQFADVLTSVVRDASSEIKLE